VAGAHGRRRVIEDPIGEAITDPDGTGVRGRAAVEEFYDRNIATNDLSITCEETFPSGSPYEVAPPRLTRPIRCGCFSGRWSRG